MKCTLLLLVLLGIISPAVAQVNTVPQIGVETAILKQRTYSAASIGLVPPASSTDIFCISGSTTASISIKQIRITGVAGTAVSMPFTLLHRVTLDTGGTAATTTALPVATPNNPSDSAASAVLIAYTAVPTINDTSPTYLRSQYVNLPLTSTAAVVPAIMVGGEMIGEFSKAFDIPKSVVGQYCINMNTTSVSSGVLNIDITWTEM